MSKISVGPSPVKISWTIEIFNSDLGPGIQVWQYVNGAGDKGFSCLAKDYNWNVNHMTGGGQLGNVLSDYIHEHLRTNGLSINNNRPEE